MIRRLLIATLSCAVFAVALLVWRLSQGPVSLDFLTPYLAGALRDSEGNWRIEIGTVALMSDLRIHARDVAIVDAEGEALLAVPDIAVRFSLTALASRLLAPEAVEIAGAEATIIRGPDGSFGVALPGAPPGGSDDSSDIAATRDLIGELLGPPRNDSVTGFLRLVSIADGRLRLQDAESGATVTSEHTEIVFQRSEEVHHLTLKASLAVDAGAVTPIEGELEIQPANGGFALAGSLKAADVGVDNLKLYWPQNAAKGARRWVTERVPKGRVPQAVVDVALQLEEGLALKLTHLGGSFRYEGLEVRWSDEAPPLTAVVGTATFDRTSMRFDVSGGVADKIRIRSGRVDLLGLDGDRENLKIRAVGAGPVSSVFALIPASSDAARPAAMSGDSSLVVDAAFPLRAGLSFADVDLRVHAEPNGVRLTRAELDAVVSGKVRYEKPPAQPGTVVGDLNVEHGRVDVGPLHWKQPAREKGEVGFQLSWSTAERRVDPLKINCPGLQAVGSAVISTSATSSSVNFRNVVLGDTKLDALAARWGRQGIVARLGRGSLDLGPLLADGNDGGNAKGADSEGIGTDLEISAPALSRVSFDADSWLENVSATVIRQGGDWRTATLTSDLPTKLWSSSAGAVNGKKVLVIRLEPTGTARRLDAHTEDLGAMLRALNLTDGMSGGALVVSGRADDSGRDTRLRAHVKATGFVVKEAPLLLRVLTVAALERFISTMRGEGLQFDSLKGIVILQAGRYELQNFRAHGSSLGWTAKGWIDSNTDRLSVEGVLIPAYAASKVLKGIPLLGNLLIGRDSSGFIAISYKVQGDVRQPQITTNPLTALTPGMLREVWDLGPKDD